MFTVIVILFAHVPPTLIMKLMELKDWLNSINLNKNNQIDEDPSVEKEYPPFIINKCLSGHLDTVMFANEMNKYPFLPKKMQHDFFIHIVLSLIHISEPTRHTSIAYAVFCV